MNRQVTICIPLFNCEETISKTIDSLLNQSYEKIKIKIFDNRSTDKSGEISKEYAEKYDHIEYYLNEENLGAEGNFTKCILSAEGDYTAIFHSDDIYYQNIVKEQVEAFFDEDVVAVCTHANEIDRHGNIIGKRLIPDELSKSVNKIKKDNLRSLVFKYANFITCPSVMVKSDVLRNKIRSWNIEEFGTSADLDVWLRLNKLGSFIFLASPLMGYRVAEQSYSFRIAKTRITRHDLFKVLDREEGLSKQEYKFKNFLEFKDVTLRTINLIRSKKHDVELPKFRYRILSHFKISFYSKWHMKIFIVGFIIYISRPLLLRPIRKILGHILG